MLLKLNSFKYSVDHFVFLNSMKKMGFFSQSRFLKTSWYQKAKGKKKKPNDQVRHDILIPIFNFQPHNSGSAHCSSSRRFFFHPDHFHKLNDQNYLQWSQFVMMFIYGKGKDEFSSGASTCLAKSNPRFRAWNSEIIWSCLVDQLHDNY